MVYACMSERSKETALKTVDEKSSGGSNPSTSAIGVDGSKFHTLS